MAPHRFAPKKAPKKYLCDILVFLLFPFSPKYVHNQRMDKKNISSNTVITLLYQCTYLYQHQLLWWKSKCLLLLSTYNELRRNKPGTEFINVEIIIAHTCLFANDFPHFLAKYCMKMPQWVKVWKTLLFTFFVYDHHPPAL